MRGFQRARERRRLRRSTNAAANTIGSSVTQATASNTRTITLLRVHRVSLTGYGWSYSSGRIDAIPLGNARAAGMSGGCHAIHVRTKNA